MEYSVGKVNKNSGKHVVTRVSVALQPEAVGREPESKPENSEGRALI
jgi:hypothetical protein